MDCAAIKSFTWTTTPPPGSLPRCWRRCCPILTDSTAILPACTPSAARWGGNVTEARAQIAALLGAQPDEIIFTSCGTESDSTAIFSALQSYPDKRHIVTTRVEHPAVKNLCESLGSLTGHKHRVTSCRWTADGILDLDEYEKAWPMTPPSSASCGPTTRPGSFFRSRKWPPWPGTAASSFTPMRCRRSARFPST